MAEQYTQGPEAAAMESGYRLDELLRRERAATKRQKMEQDWRTEQSAQTHQNRLAEMMYGEKLKEDARQQQAGEQADALGGLFENSPEARTAFGYTKPTPAMPSRLTQPVNPLEDEEAAAYIPRTPGTIGTPGNMPTREQLIGMAKSAPGLFAAYTQKRLEGTPKPESKVVPYGSGVWNPVTKSWDVEPSAKVGGEGGYATSDEALVEISRLEGLYPGTKGRWETDMNDKGRWIVKSSPTSTMTPQDPNRVMADLEMKGLTRTPEYQRAAAAANSFNARMATQAGARSAASSWNVWRPDEITRIRENSERAANLERLDSYTPGQMAAFLGAPGKVADVTQYLAGLPGGVELMKKFGDDPQKFLTEAAEFKQAQAMDLKYVLSRVDGAGGTMTAQERDLVIGQFAGAARNPAEMKARLRVHRAVLLAERDLVTYRHESDPTVYAHTASEKFKEYLEKYAPGVMRPGKGGVQSQMTPSQRLRGFATGEK